MCRYSESKAKLATVFIIVKLYTTDYKSYLISFYFHKTRESSLYIYSSLNELLASHLNRTSNIYSYFIIVVIPRDISRAS